MAAPKSFIHLVKLVLALLGIVDCGLIPVVEEMASRNETITAIVTRTACNEDSSALVEGLKLEY